MINFYRKNIPHAAEHQKPLQQFLGDSRKNDKRPICWTPETESAFEQVKNSLAHAILLNHPAENVETRLVTDASD